MFLTFVGGTALQMWHDAASNMNTFGGQAGSAHVAAQEDEVRSHSNAEMTYHGGRFRPGARTRRSWSRCTSRTSRSSTGA